MLPLTTVPAGVGRKTFNIDMETCGRCGGSLKVIACIEDQDVIDRILDHLRQKEQTTPALPLLVPPTRAPPGTVLLAGNGWKSSVSEPIRARFRDD